MALTTKTKKKNGETKEITGVEQNNKFYPTTNPDFQPAAEGTTTQIKFNQNGSIDYTPKGGMETFNLSKEEYNALIGKPGFTTEKTKNIQAQQLNPLQAQQEALAEQQATELKQLGQEDFTKIGQEQQVQTVDQTQMQTPQEKTPGQRVLDYLSGKSMQEAAQRAGGELVAGTAPLIAPAGALPALNFGKTLTKAKNAITSLKNIKILGAIGTIGYFTGARVREIESDINDMTSLSKTLASQVSSGADPVEVRQQLIDMENAIRDKVAEMNVAKKYSITDRLSGSDSQEYARKQLTLIALRRQAVERYMLTNDLNSFNAFMGAQTE